MPFKYVLWTILFAIILFITIVSLGLKYQWGGQITKTTSSVDTEVTNDDSVLDDKGEKLFDTSGVIKKTTKKETAAKVMNEEEQPKGDVVDNVRAQCQQLARESAITAEQFEDTVEACVLLTLDTEDDFDAEVNTKNS